MTTLKTDVDVLVKEEDIDSSQLESLKDEYDVDTTDDALDELADEYMRIIAGAVFCSDDVVECSVRCSLHD